MSDPEVTPDECDDESADVGTGNPSDRELTPEEPPPVAGGTYHLSV